MKRICISCLVVTLLIIVPVKADLVEQDYLNNGQKVVLDTATGYHWYWGMNYFDDMTYDQQITTIDGLATYGNIAGGWHMASLALIIRSSLSRTQIPSCMEPKTASSSLSLSF